jgi:aryl-alcohol dehydrogenase-like predicted oxidoreductase
MQSRPLGRSNLSVSPIGFGAFKIGRNQNTKYAAAYSLPDDQAVDRLLGGVLDLGITYFDTAPAYGTSEEQVGRAIAHRRREFTLSTKVGEIFSGGQSRYDFSAAAVRSSIENSLSRLKTDVLDIVYIHAHGADVEIQASTDVVPALQDVKLRGLVRAIGLSAKTEPGARCALDWADAIMVEYHLDDRSCSDVIAAAAERGVGVVVKKGLASGRLTPGDAIRFVLGNSGVSSLVVGGLNLEHIRANVEAARSALDRSSAS